MKQKMHEWLGVSDNIERKAPRKLFMVLLLLMFACGGTYQKLEAQHTQVSFQVFYDQLSPHGTWIDYPDYGYVWIPRGYPGFYPYATGGSWVYTDYGWTWVSNYSWGWAPFHYGRWYYDSFYGWLWVPGTEWAPAWVVWRNSPDYYGWAPMAPGWSLSVSIGYNAPAPYWTFVHCRNFGHRDSYRYYAPRKNNTTIINNTTVINNVYVDKSRNTTYYTGPHREHVQKSTGKPVHAMAVKERGQPGQSMSGQTVSMYRPQMQAHGGKNPNGPAPAKYVKANEGKAVTVERQPSGKPTNANPSKVGEKPHKEPSHQPATKMPSREGKPVGAPPKKEVNPPQRQPVANPKVYEDRNAPNRPEKASPPMRKESPPMGSPRPGTPDRSNEKAIPEQPRNAPPRGVDQPRKEVQTPRNIPSPSREMPRERPKQRMTNPPSSSPTQGHQPRQGGRHPRQH
jgi:hypothetical protein